VFFSLASWQLALVIFACVLVPTVAGLFIGRALRKHSAVLREPFGVLQAALLGLVGLILAFGLTMAVGRYEDRRAAVVAEANAIGTTYLRAQTLAEPMRSRSLALLKRYTDVSIHISHTVPSSDAARTTIAESDRLQRRLWRLAGQSLVEAPVASAPRLYVETLNETFDTQEVRVAARNNRIPMAVLTLEIIGSAVALGLLAVYMGMLDRGVVTVLSAAALITLLLLVTFDLDRPTRGLITVPDAALVHERESMVPPPAAAGPTG
jgi:ABC-type multidrug transport system fused ATPase/permease subunit